MSNRPFQKGVNTVKPKVPSEAEAKCLKRQQELVTEDCKRVCNVDIHKPFVNLKNAAERLVPFHIFSSIDGDQADVFDTVDHEGTNLICSRSNVWADVVLKQSLESIKKVETLRQRLERLEKNYENRFQHRPVEELYAHEKLLLSDTHEWASAERVSNSIMEQLASEKK